MDKQMVIPGLESLAPEPPPYSSPRLNIRQQIAALQEQVIKLDVEVTLLRLEVESGELG